MFGLTTLLGDFPDAFAGEREREREGEMERDCIPDIFVPYTLDIPQIPERNFLWKDYRIFQEIFQTLATLFVSHKPMSLGQLLIRA